MDQSRRVFIITGEKHQGKTGLLIGVAAEMKRRGMAFRGFLSEAVWEDHAAVAYHLTDLHTGNRFPLCHLSAQDGWIDLGRYHFNPDAVAMGTEILLKAGESTPRAILIDEVGRMESLGLVWDSAIRSLLAGTGCTLVWTTRTAFVPEIVTHYELINYILFETGEHSAEHIVNSL